MGTGTPAATVMGGLEMALEDTLVAYIGDWTTENRYKVKHTKRDPSYSDAESSDWEYGPVAVHAGMLPKNEVGVILVDKIPVFPFVLCHIKEGKDRVSEGSGFISEVHTKIIVGMWDDDADYQGYRDAVALLRKIVRSLWYWNTLAQTYQINTDSPAEWRVYDSNEVTWPFFLAEATICWRMREPIWKADSEDLDWEPQPNYIYGYPAQQYPTKQVPAPGRGQYE